MTHKANRIILGLIIVMLVGCGSPLPTPFTSPAVSPISVLPTPTLSAPQAKVVRFQLDRPLKAGAAMVTGGGPAGIPISIESVTTMGEVLGIGTIGSDNRFAITVSPLTANVRIGIALGDLSGTNHTNEEFNADAYKGDDALVMPMVGYYLDTALVQP